MELVGTCAGHRDNRGLRREVPEHGDELQAMHYRHLKIRDNDFDAFPDVLPKGFFPIHRDVRFVTLPFEDHLLEQAIGFRVVDNEYSRHGDEL